MQKQTSTETAQMTMLDISSDAIGVALAAGLGTRLRPLTLENPKPLIPFCGIEILYLVVENLKNSGLCDIGLNTHYMPEKVLDFVKNELPSSSNDLSKTFVSIEKNKILGTAGCYPAFNSFRNKRSIVTANGDVLSSTNVKDLFEFHQKSEATATMAVLKNPHPTGAQVWVIGSDIVHIGNDNGGFDGATPHGFACFQVLSDYALSMIEEDQYQELVPIYKKLISENKKVCAYIHDAIWFDLGTHADYFNAHMFVLKLLDESKDKTDPFGIIKTLRKKGLEVTFVSSSEKLENPNGFEVAGPSLIIGDFNTFGPARIGPNSVVMEGAQFKNSPEVESAVVLPFTEINSNLHKSILYKEHLISISDT